MAGLLDLINTPEGQLSLRLLAAGGARPGPRNTGAGLLEAFGGTADWQNQQQARAAAEEDRKLRAQALLAQISETQAQAAQRQSAVEQAKREAQQQDRFLAELRGGVSPQQALSAGGGPTPANAARMSQGPDFAALALKFPSQAKLLEQLAGSKNWGRDEVARTLPVAGPDNMPMTRRESKFGDPIGQDTRDPVKMQLENLGGMSQAINPFALRDGQQFQRTNSPDSLLSAQTAMRGQNMTDARAREKNQIDKSAVGKVEWKQDVNGSWIALPKEIGAGPVTPITTTGPGKREQQAQNAMDIIKLAEPLLPKATSSYVGAGVDFIGRAFGGSPGGADEAAQLKALEGALMMAQPRMEGPQSNMDVQLYKQMAARIGDSTVPVSQKQAALGTIKELHQRYGSGQSPVGLGGFRVLGKE